MSPDTQDDRIAELKRATAGRNGNGAGKLLGVEAQRWTTPEASERASRGSRFSDNESSNQGGQASLADDVTLWASPRASMAMNGNDSGSAQREEQGPNPGLKDQAKNWTTPQATEAESKERPSRAATGRTTEFLGRQVKTFSPQVPPPTGDELNRTCGRRLNPAFVCWLMGVPWFWTRAEPINSAAAEMDAYRSALRSLLSSLLGERESPIEAAQAAGGV